MFIYKRPRYNSESDDSNDGARCCASSNCPETKPPQLSTLIADLWVPPPDNNPSADGHARQIVVSADNPGPAAVNYNVPDNADAVPFGATYTAPIGWSYTYYFGLDQAQLDAAMYDITQVTTVASVGASEYIQPQSNITITKLTPGELPFNWNGTTIYNATSNAWKITIFPLVKDVNPSPPPDDLVLELADLVVVDFQLDIKLSYVPNPNCDDYFLAFDGNVEQTETPEDPIANYKLQVSNAKQVNNQQWYNAGVIGSFDTCDSFISSNGVPGYVKIDNAETSIILQSKHHVNQAYWDSVEGVGNFTPNELVITLEQYKLSNWTSSIFKEIQNETGYPPGEYTRAYKSNAGTDYDFQCIQPTFPNNPNPPWGTTGVIPSPDAKSLDFDDNAYETTFDNGDAFFQFNFQPGALRQGTIAFLYRWTDTTANGGAGKTIIHFNPIRISKGIYERRLLALPIDPCWNSNINYDFPQPVDYASITTQLYESPLYTSLWLPRHALTVDDVPDAADYDAAMITAPGTPRAGYLKLMTGAADTSADPEKNKFYVQFPFFFDGTNTSMEFRDTSYTSRDEITTYTGAPRTVTWSVCDPAGAGSIANGQWNFLQANSSYVRDFATGGTGLSNCQGLMYIKLNISSFPGGDDTNTTGVQHIRAIQTRLPTDCYLKIVGVEEWNDPDFGGAWPYTVGPTNTSVTKTVTLRVDDNYPGDLGRSIVLHHRVSQTPTVKVRLNKTDNPANWAYTRTRNFSAGIASEITLTTVRDYFDPVTNELKLPFYQSNTRYVFGISYLAQLDPLAP